MTTSNFNVLPEFLKGNWAKRGLFYMPSSPPEKGNFLEYIKTYITHEEIYGERYTIAEMEDCLAQISYHDAIATISLLYAIFHNDRLSSLDEQTTLAVQVFNKDIKKQLIETLGKENADNRIVFFEEQFLLAMVAITLFCSDSEPTGFEEGQQRDLFTRFLWGVTDLFIKPDSERDREATRRFIVSLIIRSYMFNYQSQFKYLIPRAYLLFIEIPSSEEFKTKPNYVDIKTLFHDLTGIGLEEYFYTCFAVLSKYVHVSLGDMPSINLPNFILDKDTFFNRTAIRDMSVNDVLNILSSSRDESRDKFQFDVDDKEFPYGDFLYLKGKPLLRLDESHYLPYSVRYFKEYMTSGIFWLLADSIKEALGDKQRLLFTRFFGIIFESYIQMVFKRMFGDGPPELNRVYFNWPYRDGKKNKEASDIVIFYEDTVVFIEVKSSRLRMRPIATTGEYDSFAQNIQEVMVGENGAAAQLDKVISDFLAGKIAFNDIDVKSIKRIIPLFISIEPIPLHDLTWPTIEEVINNNSLFVDERITRIYILDCEEIEIIEPLVQEGASLLDLVNGHLESALKNQSFKNYLYYLRRDIRLQDNQYLMGKFEEIHKKLKEYVFPE